MNLDRLLPKTSFGRFFLINVISLALFWLLIQPMANYWRNQALFRMVASNESRLFLTHIRLLDKLPTIAERNGLFNPNDDVFSIRVSHLPPDMPQDGSNYSRSLRRRLERAFKQENIRYTDLLTRIVVSHAPITVMNSEEKYSDLETFLTHHYMQAEIALRRPDGIWIYAKHQIEIMPQPPVGHNDSTPWPQWPIVLKTTSSHEEGCTRRWSLASNQFIGKNGKVCGVEVEEVEWTAAQDGGRPTMKPTGKKEIIDADMVLLAMGFLKPEQPEFPENVFVAGDAARGASLVVHALADGRKAAQRIDEYLNK